MCNKYIYLLCGFQSTNSDRFSGDSYEGPPVPISNTVVKLVNAESTWLETAWEDRKSLIKLKRLTVWLAFFIIVFRLVRDVVANHKTTRYAGAATKVIQKNHLA